MVVPKAEEIVIVVSLVGEQGEAESERQRDAERGEEKIFQRVFLQEISKQGHGRSRGSILEEGLLFPHVSGCKLPAPNSGISTLFLHLHFHFNLHSFSSRGV